MQFTFLEVYGGLQCKKWLKNKKNAAAGDDDDIFSNSSNYLQDFDQLKSFTMIIIMKRESELQE